MHKFTVTFAVRDDDQSSVNQLEMEESLGNIPKDAEGHKTSMTDNLQQVFIMAGLVRLQIMPYRDIVTIFRKKKLNQRKLTEPQILCLHFFEKLCEAIESGFSNGKGKLLAEGLCELFYGGPSCLGRAYSATSKDFGFKLCVAKPSKKIRILGSTISSLPFEAPDSSPLLSYSSSENSNRNRNFRQTDALYEVRVPNEFNTYIQRVIIEVKSDCKDRDEGISQVLSFAFGIMQGNANISKMLLVVLDPFNWYMAPMTRGQEHIQATRYILLRDTIPSEPSLSVRNLLSFLREFENFEANEFL